LKHGEHPETRWSKTNKGTNTTSHAIYMSKPVEVAEFIRQAAGSSI
jgi:hypothetical protein